MAKKELVVFVDYSQKTMISGRELCEICHLSFEEMQDFIAYDILHPTGESDEWLFDLNELQRIKRALRLQHDLEVNLAGAAVILDLLEQMENLRKRAELLEHHILK